MSTTKTDAWTAIRENEAARDRAWWDALSDVQVITRRRGAWDACDVDDARKARETMERRGRPVAGWRWPG